MILDSKYFIRQTPMLDVCVNNQQIQQGKEIKLMRVKIEQTISWSSYIQKLVTKMRKNIATTGCNVYFIPFEIRKSLLQS